MNYTVEFKPKAQKDLDDLTPDVRRRIIGKIGRLQEIADRLNISRLDLIEATHSELPRFPTISVYISATLGSTPALPPVVSSIREPCNFFARVQQISSGATQLIEPSSVPAHNAA